MKEPTGGLRKLWGSGGISKITDRGLSVGADVGSVKSWGLQPPSPQVVLSLQTMRCLKEEVRNFYFNCSYLCPC